MPVTFSGYSRAETLTNFPALVVLSTNLPGFSYSQFASRSGHDLRFSDAAGSELNYEIERWGGAISEPTEIPGCRLWLRADAGVMTNGSWGVTNWLDQSGYNSGAMAPSGQEPSLVASVVNGNPVIRFDGADDCLRNTNWAPGFTTSGKFTYFFVSRLVGIVDVEGFFGQRAAGQSNDYGNNSSLSIEQESTAPGGLRYYRNGSPNIQVLRNNATFRIDTLAADGSGTYAFLDGVFQGAGAAFASSLNPSEYGIGIRLTDSGGIGAYGQVDFAEIIIYTNTLDATQMNQVGGYLARKYGLSSNYEYGGASHVWVQVPALASSTRVYAHWGNPLATVQPTYATNGATWSEGFKGVWHLSEPAGNVVDSTSARYVGVNYNTYATNALIASGRFLDGSGDYFDLTGLLGNAVLPTANRPVSVSAWAKPRTINSGDNEDRIITIHDGNPSSALAVGVGQSDNAQFYSDDGSGATVTGSKVLSVNNWYHIACTYDGTTYRLLVDGAEDGTVNDGLNAGFAYAAKLGSFDTASSHFDGSLDEIRLHSVARSTNWVWAEWLNMATNSEFASYATIQVTGGTFVGWPHKMKITFSGYDRSEVLTNFPALVVLSESNITQFAYSQFASPNGYDLRFADATESVELNYEVEFWDTNANSYVWVQVPELANGTYIWAYWGKPDALDPEPYTTNGATWSEGFVSVLHLKESSGSRMDSSSQGNDGTANGTTHITTGRVDGAESFNGTGNSVTLASAPAIDPRGDATLSVWLKVNAYDTGAMSDGNGDYFIDRVVSGTGYPIISLKAFTGGAYGMQVRYDDNSGLGGPTGGAIDTANWQYVSIVRKYNSQFRLNVDGRQVAASTDSGSKTITLDRTKLGAHTSTAASSLNGLLDEFRASSVARSTNWMWAEYLNIASNALFAGYSSVVAGGGLSGELPFIETFEDRTVAILHGQNNWQGTPPEYSQVQRDVVYAGSQAAIIAPDGVLSHLFTNAASATTLWIDFYVRPVHGTNDPVTAGLEPTAAFYVNTNGYFRALSNDTWVTLDAYEAGTGQWHRFSMGINYLSSTWELHATDATPNRTATLLATNLAFGAGATNTQFTAFEARHWWFMAR